MAMPRVMLVIRVGECARSLHLFSGVVGLFLLAVLVVRHPWLRLFVVRHRVRPLQNTAVLAAGGHNVPGEGDAGGGEEGGVYVSQQRMYVSQQRMHVLTCRRRNIARL